MAKKVLIVGDSIGNAQLSGIIKETNMDMEVISVDELPVDRSYDITENLLPPIDYGQLPETRAERRKRQRKENKKKK